MTEPIDDEFASAALDGDATAAEQARIAADPRLAARVEVLRSARAALAADVPQPDPQVRARAIAAAMLAAVSTPTHTAETPIPAETDEAVPPVAPMAPHRARRPGRSWWAAGEAAAAVVAAVGLAAVLVRQDDRGTSGTAESVTTAAGRDSASSATQLAPEAAAGGAADTGPPGTVAADTGTKRTDGTTTAVPPAAPPPQATLPDLGSVDATSLASALAPMVQAGPARSDTAFAGAACPAPAPGARLVARATWEGGATLVFVVDAPPARALLLAVDDCHAVADVPRAEAHADGPGPAPAR